MKNRYEVRGDITVIFVNYKKEIFETVIDTHDLERAEDFPGTWFARRDVRGDTFYVYGKLNSKSVILHRYITNAPKGMTVDHINHQTLDNRTSCNLRVVTHLENNQNKKLAKNNKSGYRGVARSSNNKWVAHVIIGGKRTYLGSFDDPAVAAEVVNSYRSSYQLLSKEVV